MSITTTIRSLAGTAQAGWHSLTHFDRMPADQRERWQAARSVRALGRTCALYLEGHIPSQPAYQPGWGIDQETRDLVPVLARANRAGFYTTNSQPALHPGYPDLNAWVVGFADELTAQQLYRLLCGSGLSYRLYRTRRRYVLAERGKVGSRPLKDREIRLFYDDCHPIAVEALVDAVQVHIEDPTPGRDDRLWPLLSAYADGREANLNRATSGRGGVGR